jgi:xylulose-5-phosphate/fructose-6-phosphate phosphoketolase
MTTSPMIVLNSPEDWTGESVADGLPIEGALRSHQLPWVADPQPPEHLSLLESWMRRY